MAFMWARDMQKKFGDKHINQIEVIKLLPQLEDDVWSDDKHYDIRPIDVIKDKNLSPMHWEAITRANLDYPIFLNNGMIIDGFHRVCKAYITK
jgi:hypothetical protein